MVALRAHLPAVVMVVRPVHLRVAAVTARLLAAAVTVALLVRLLAAALAVLLPVRLLAATAVRLLALVLPAVVFRLPAAR